MVLLVLTGLRAKMAFWDRGATEETLVQRVWLDLRDYQDPQDLLGLPDRLENVEKLDLEDQLDPQEQLAREVWWDRKDPEEIGETWETMESEDRRDTEDSLDFRVSLDLPAPLENRELQESWDPADKGDLKDPLDLQEKKVTSGTLGQWDHPEPEVSPEKSDLRVPQESLDPQAPLARPVLPWQRWTTCLLAHTTMTLGPLPLQSSVRTRPCPTVTRAPLWLWTRESRPR